MSESIHTVCPHCSAVNRIPADRPASEATCGACKASLFTGEPIALTAKTFDKHIERNDMPLIVDFWAPWCGPCRTMAPIFDRAAKELEPRARFAKVNVDEEPAIAARFGIRGIPTLIAFEKGKVAKQHAGLVDHQFLEGVGGLICERPVRNRADARSTFSPAVGGSKAMRQILLAAYVGIAPLTCHAEERGGRSSPALAPVEAKLKRCTAENPGNIPERLCADDARQAVDGVLTRIYAQIVAGLKRPTNSSDGDSRNKEILRRLVASERAWIAYRDSECLERSGSMLGGSGEATILVECEYSLERDRVNDLFDLYKDELPEIAK